MAGLKIPETVDLWDFPTQASLGFTDYGLKKKEEEENIQRMAIFWVKMSH